ncbi:alpha/beta fold hydrolase [Streptomyces sp. NPDC002018]|uniref:alpha/beta fold hydrolase n=1 Tax=Streptomyces sp. NPDC002018 TaxID=3364629 RepID=UPI00367AE20E
MVPDTTGAPSRYVGGLAAESHGAAAADDRPPLLLLHGLSYDRRQWGPLLRELASTDPARRVLALDLPGHGGSPRHDSYALDEVAAAVHRAVSESGLTAPTVVGHSLGGVLATVYAARYPASGVVNIDQPLLAGGFADMLRRNEPVLRSPAYGRIWDSLLARMGVESLPRPVRDLARPPVPPAQDLLLGYWNELLVRPASELREHRAHDLARIASQGIPYHYVTGEEADPGYLAWLRETSPGVAVTVLPGSGHFPHLVHLAELARILAATV